MSQAAARRQWELVNAFLAASRAGDFCAEGVPGPLGPNVGQAALASVDLAAIEGARG